MLVSIVAAVDADWSLLSQSWVDGIAGLFLWTWHCEIDTVVYVEIDDWERWMAVSESVCGLWCQRELLSVLVVCFKLLMCFSWDEVSSKKKSE